MDIAAGNGLADPSWRCRAGAPIPGAGASPAIAGTGRDGTPDKRRPARQQVGALRRHRARQLISPSTANVDPYGGPEEWGYRRMILHYAQLCAAAGGVDAFLIGSELRGLTTLRDAEGSYPFVDGAGAACSGGEGHPAGCEGLLCSRLDGVCRPPARRWHRRRLYFHLDPLWASPSIDFVGIDNYMPLADWRDGDAPCRPPGRSPLAL